MAHLFLHLRAVAEVSVAQAVSRALQERDEAKEEELGATVLIQRQVRRHFAYQLYKRKRFACLEISRVFRGHCGRLACARLQKLLDDEALMSMFHYQACAIQHVFRGFHSRKYKHDFHARKAYIANILEKSSELRMQLAANRERATQEEQERKLREMQDDFKKVAQKLHHLLSTKSRPGVYNSPYALEGPPTAFGVPVEEHLRNYTTELLRNEGLRPPHKHRRRVRKSVQASSEYDVCREATRAESRRSRTMRISEQSFVAGGKGRLCEAPQGPGLSAGTEFIDAWRIKTTNRGQKLPPGQSNFQTALPKNQLFDEIADQHEVFP
ncbi:Spermatosis-associated protein 17 [Hondaea fermentalgiana]|uniref:Spermatosis-associated protein 17 n=1 Tax=Hondaea fermentalgiana TaxID=2315210 RepID=A0A2R5FZN7_9STRA|nr:Spermatosis-associated protein 17 [Hondaea fermentalgiana]|eukprot:GBG24227.1 Spermatosis-associated protein 17 [Hondaea fermentalgiana]